MSLFKTIKNTPKLDSFFTKFSRIVSKGEHIKGLLFIGIDTSTGKVVVYKGFFLDKLTMLGTITSKIYCVDLIVYLHNIGISPADESMLPDSFLNQPYTFYIVNTEKQEKFEF